MKLAYVAKMFPRISETFLLRELEALRRAGAPVRIYSILPPIRDDKMHPEAKALSEETVLLAQPTWKELPRFVASLLRTLRLSPLRAVTEIARALLPPTPRSFRLLWRAVTLADHMRQEQISHVHAAWAHTPASVCEVASRLTRIPWSMAAHAKDIHTSNPRSLARKMSSARFTLACTAHHRDLLRGIADRYAGSFVPGEIHLAYHGVDAATFAPADDSSSSTVRVSRRRAPRILFVGRLVPKKGADVLIEATARLRELGIEVEVELIGQGPERMTLERRIKELGLREIVCLRGLCLRDDVLRSMRDCDCFVLPCRVAPDGDRDGIPNSLAEAMASGLAVVSSRLPSIEELVEHGVSGILVPPDDANSLADALARLLRDDEARRRLGARAREIIRDRFDATRCEPERIRHHMRASGIARVLYLSGDRGVPARGGKGASIHVRAVIQAWRRLGVESLLVTANAGPPEGPEPAAEVIETAPGPFLARAAGVLSRPLPGARKMERALLRLGHNVAFYRAAARAATSWRPDMVYERYALCSTAGSFLARRLGVPHVLEVNAPLADEEAHYRGLSLATVTRWIEGWTLRRADVVVVVSQPLEMHAIRLGVRPDRIRVLPNGVDPTLFHPGRDGTSVRERLGLDGEFVAGFSGSLKAWHGVAHLIRAFAAASSARAGMKLLILGDGPERDRLETLAHECGTAARVIFTGAVPHAAMGDYLSACDVLCAPYGASSDFYFSPIKIGEYLASGRPVIASDIAHLKHSLGEASNSAIWTAPGDEAAIRTALLELAADPVRRNTLARRAASAVWTWSDVAGATLAETERARARLWKWPSRPPLTVGYVVKVFPRFSETFILNEILELERIGVRVVIFSMKRHEDPIRQPGVERVRAPVVVLPDLARSRARLLRAHLGSIGRAPSRYVKTAAYVRERRNDSARTKFLHAAILAVEARKLGVDRLHAHFASGPARQAKFASMLSGIPFSFTAHAKDLYWNGHRGCRKLERKIRLASFVVAISEHNVRFLEGVADGKKGRIVRIYNGLDLAAWPFSRPAGRPFRRAGRLPADGDGGTESSLTGAEPPLVLAVGRLVEKKGFHVLLEALGILRARDVSFRCLILGDGPEEGRLQAMVKAFGLGSHVQLPGAVRQDRLAAELYAQAHVLAQPSVIAADGDQDGIPTVILEALAIGLPVIATPVSGIGEVIVDGETGITVQPGDTEALADAISRALLDDVLVSTIASRGRRLIEERFDLRENAKHLVRRLTGTETS